jgi:stage II sporulation protein R
MKKLLNWLNKNRLNILGASVAGLAAVFLFSTALAARSADSPWQNHIIRLHILAADDTAHEQELKLTLRDGIWEFIGGLLSDSGNISEAADIIAQNLPLIEDEARRILQNEGANHAATARLVENLPFPPMAYGAIFLPQGNYRALQIIIGEGYGENWWCIIFPPICFIDITRGGSSGLEDDLENGVRNSRITLRPRLRIAEIWQRANN